MNVSSQPLHLAAIQAPTPVLNKSWNFVEWGTNHSFMQEVLSLIRYSPTALAMTNRKALFVAGEGFTCDEKKYKALAKFLKKVAPTGKYRTANKLLKRLAKDLVKLRAFALQVVWSKDGKYITELYHQRVETVASGPLNEDEEVDTYWLCRDWTKRQLYKPKPIPAFNPETAKKDKVQLLYWFAEDAGTEYYPELDTVSVLNYLKVEGRLSKYHDNRVATRFGIDTVMMIRKGPENVTKEDGTVVTAEQQRTKFQEATKQKFQGEESESLLFLWGDGTDESADKMLDIKTVTVVTPELFKSVAEEASQKIMSAGGVTSPVVIGLPGGGNLGGDGAEIREAYEMYFNSVCRPDQVNILEVFYDDILPHIQGIGEDLPGLDDDEPALDIITNLPVKFMFSENLLELILTDDELRKMISYNPLEPNQKPAGEKPNPTPDIPLAPGATGATGKKGQADDTAPTR